MNWKTGAPFLFAALLLTAAGTESLGRLSLHLDLPSIASKLLNDPAAKGVALFKQGDFAAADKAFAEAGRSQTFNRGLSLAANGQYSLSLAYFDAVLFASPSDATARDMRELVAQMIDPVVGQTSAPGRIKATKGQKAPKPVTSGLPALPDPEKQKKVEARGIQATDDWLFTITDDPGTFLKLRLQAEYERRASLGLARPVEGSKW